MQGQGPDGWLQWCSGGTSTQDYATAYTRQVTHAAYFPQKRLLCKHKSTRKASTLIANIIELCFAGGQQVTVLFVFPCRVGFVQWLKLVELNSQT